MKRIVGIDFGLKRTGIAITDENNIIASGLQTVSSEKLMDFLKELVKEKNVGTIVLGEPKRMNMEDSHISENVRLLYQALQQQFPTLTIELIDERFTSKMALDAMIAGGMKKKKRKQKGLIDEVSATIILQSYMSQHNL